MKLTIIGAGYVGLVTGACFSDVGHHVSCLDINKKKIKNLDKGIMPIFENGLEKLVAKNIKAKRLFFTSEYSKAIDHSDVIFLAVDTPSKSDGSADLTSIKKACISIAETMTSNKTIVEKSTVPVGTSEVILGIFKKKLKALKKDLSIEITSNPEFLKEGSAIEDFTRPDRIIVGTNNISTRKKFDSIYKPFNRKSNKIQYMDVKSAEFTKYAANSMLATKISFINDLSIIADKLKVDIEDIRLGIGSDKRIGYEFLYPGCGYGGSCFPKDVNALIGTAKKHLHNSSLLKAVNSTNDKQKIYLFSKMKKFFKNNFKGKKIGVWGLAFKPNTNDIRYAPSIEMIKLVLKNQGSVIAYDPIATLKELPDIYNNDNYIETNSYIKALKNTDALLICTEWKEFWSIDTSVFLKSMKTPVIFDGRNIYPLEKFKGTAIKYYGVGRNFSE
jgi:UDPglucose 6-dehydrogenase